MMSSAAAASVLRLSRHRSLAAPLGSYRNHQRSLGSSSFLAASTSSGQHDSHNNQFRFQYSYRTLTAIAAGGSAVFLSTTSSSSSSASCEKKKMEAPPVGEPFPLKPPKNREVVGPKGIPSRAEQIRRLKSSTKDSEPYDILVIGGGATGAGIAFDAATRTDIPNNNGLRVACIERGDFASETSSRSTKLIWAGIKYLASASAALLSWDLLTNPITTVKDFYSEFSMVFNCHQERKYMLDKQRHLTNWVPIVCPFTEWNIWPPPFGHPIFSFFPVLAPAVFKFYDALSQFTCPPSYIMTKKEARTKFPQLSEQDIKYCAVFYEGQHNDSRTNIAIALSAAEKGAHIANYVEMTEGIFDENGKVVGVKAEDRISGETFEIYAKHIIFAGGPFTDKLRNKEQKTGESVPPAVQGASGSHIVLPGYFAPKDMGLLDYNTSDGRFLFFLPWQGSVIVGTTDKKCDAETLPYPPEEEIQWMMKEVEKYLSNDLKVRRSDVLSAWRGWRPLALDPHAPPGGQVSRDHVISTNPTSGVTFIAGGKWTTWREMAEDVLDKVLGDKAGKCNTLDILLHGGEGYHKSLSIQLIQKYGISEEVAEHLVRTYGGRVWEVVEKCKPTGKQWPRYGVQLVDGYPYIEAEVRFACQEYACTIEDILSRRTRLAFLNSEAAWEALPRVAEIMAEELGWNKATKKEQIKCAEKYLAAYGGRIPYEDDIALRFLAYEDAMDMFRDIDRDGSGFIDPQELKEIATRLGNPLSDKQLKALFRTIDTDKNGKISAEEFVAWIQDEQSKNDVKKYFHATATKIFEDIDTDGSGFLDKEELKAVTIRLGEVFTDKEISKIFKAMDKNKDGKVGLKEFINWLDKENDKTGFRKMLANNMQGANMQSAWLDERASGVTIKRKYTNSGSFLG